RGEEAFPHLREAARLRPDAADAQGNLGIYYARRGDVAAATGYFAEALRLRPESPEAHNNLGLALAQQGRIDVAAAHFHEAVRLRPGYREAQWNLARARALLGSREVDGPRAAAHKRTRHDSAGSSGRLRCGGRGCRARRGHPPLLRAAGQGPGAAPLRAPPGGPPHSA